MSGPVLKCRSHGEEFISVPVPEGHLVWWGILDSEQAGTTKHDCGHNTGIKGHRSVKGEVSGTNSIRGNVVHKEA